MTNNLAIPSSDPNPFSGEDPSLASFSPGSFSFQVFDIEYNIKPRHAELTSNSFSTNRKVPQLLLFGVSDAGKSVACHVHGFEPYFYASCPLNFVPSVAAVDALRNALNHQVAAEIKSVSQKVAQYVTAIHIVEKIPLYGFSPGARHFFKIVVGLPQHVRVARNICATGISFASYSASPMSIFEADIDFTLRFMIDRGINGASWIELSELDMVPRRESQCETTCPIEFDCTFKNVISHSPNDAEWMKIAPFKTISYDIECLGKENHFPTPEEDEVIQIANVLSIYGQEKPADQTIFVLGSCEPIVGANVYSFDSEKDLLMAWSRYIAAKDPDILTGYNIAKFDIYYLFVRAKTLGLTDFPKMGRIKGRLAVLKPQTFQSKAHGISKTWSAVIHGRVEYDVMTAIRREHKLRSYTLNNVSAHFLGQQKEDVHYSIMGKLHRGTAADRRRIASYCLKDAILPLHLIENLMILVNAIEMARVTGVPIGWLLSRGQQIKVISQLYRKAGVEGYIIPFGRGSSSFDSGGGGINDGEPDHDGGYEGATVIEPIRGFHRKPISTLDFSSLYPSIMMAHNLCYTTLVTNTSKLNPDDYITTPFGSKFIKPSIRRGLLPIILDELLSARTQAKREMKVETDPFKKKVLNGRQLALKISANSVYGFTGATVGKLPCLEISASVTSFGRDMIQHTKDFVEREYPGAKVIYGDTDSVMVQFANIESVEDAIKIGIDAGIRVTKTFPKPINLEFEKVYKPYLLMSKKRYAGLYWTRPDKWDKLDCKGIEVVRRDNCKLAQQLISQVLNKVLIENDIPGAISLVHEAIRALLTNRIDLSYLVISKGYTKSIEQYDSILPHVALVKKLIRRDKSTSPKIGDRIPYVIIEGPKRAKASEKSEDPLYALEHSKNIDAGYYLNNQLKKPLLRIFVPILGEEDAQRRLFTGSHTRKIVRAPNTSSAKATSGLFQYSLVNTLSCLNCKVPLPEDRKTVCSHCEEYEPSLYLKQLSKVSSLENDFAALWAECQRCQGNLHQDVLCSNRDCPIYYQRVKTRNELGSERKNLARFVVKHTYDW